MESSMTALPLSVNSLIPRAAQLFADQEVVSRLPDRTLRRHTYRDLIRRAQALAHALRGLGVRAGERVATLCWNHHVHLECYLGVPLCGAVLHTLNFRLSAEEIGWIADDAEDDRPVLQAGLRPALAHRGRLAAHGRRRGSGAGGLSQAR